MTNELVTKGEDIVQDIAPMSEIGQHIQMAIANDLDIDKLERLLEMKRIEEDRENQRAFLTAKAKFQRECPKVPHDQRATTPNAKWSYASLGLICETISPLLGKHGLSYRWEGEGEQMRCHLTHKDGHGESASFTLSIEGQKGGLANMTQQMRQGAADTYARGRTLCAVCGIGTAQQDTGGVSTEDHEQAEAQQSHADTAKKMQLDWLHSRHELHTKSKEEKQKRFAAWFLTHTDAKAFTPVVERWTAQQLKQCREQLDKEAKTAQYAKESEAGDDVREPDEW